MREKWKVCSWYATLAVRSALGGDVTKPLQSQRHGQRAKTQKKEYETLPAQTALGGPLTKPFRSRRHSRGQSRRRHAAALALLRKSPLLVKIPPPRTPPPRTPPLAPMGGPNQLVDECERGRNISWVDSLQPAEHRAIVPPQRAPVDPRAARGERGG